MKAYWAVVVAQLVEQSFPILEVCGLNPVIGKNLFRTLTASCIEKTEINKKVRQKESGNGPFLKKMKEQVN